jgi:hypothetical protein
MLNDLSFTVFAQAYQYLHNQPAISRQGFAQDNAERLAACWLILVKPTTDVMPCLEQDASQWLNEANTSGVYCSSDRIARSELWAVIGRLALKRDILALSSEEVRKITDRHSFPPNTGVYVIKLYAQALASTMHSSHQRAAIVNALGYAAENVSRVSSVIGGLYRTYFIDAYEGRRDALPGGHSSSNVAGLVNATYKGALGLAHLIPVEREQVRIESDEDI